VHDRLIRMDCEAELREVLERYGYDPGAYGTIDQVEEAIEQLIYAVFN
jgi:hypothetical protein